MLSSIYRTASRAARIAGNPLRMSPVGTTWAKRFLATVPAEEQDLVVIGGGPGGYVAAIKAGQLGKKVTCVEKRATLGGTCLNVGCIPSKALLHASHLYHDAGHNYAKYGVVIDKVGINLPAMMSSKDKAVTGLTRGIAHLFKKNKVSHAPGVGTIKSANEVAVTADDGSVGTIRTKNILIATGSDIVGLPFLKIDEKTVVSSTGALSLSAVPKKMVVIGGGVIGLELGSVWSRLGAEVTVVEFLPRIAAGADSKIADEFQKILTSQGIKFKTSSKVTAVNKVGDVHKISVEPAAGGATETLDADVILVSVGRRPYTDSLGLKEVGVAVDNKGRVEVDDEFRTNVPSIRAIGDVIRGPMLAHKAEDEGIAAVEFMFKGAGHVNYDAIPSVIYTNPEVAWVGKTEEELTSAGVTFRAGVFPFMANSRARTNDESAGLVKVLADAKTDRVLGVHMIGQSVGEMIAEVTLAMEYGASSEDIARTCHAHPTLSEAVKEAAMATYDKPIHF